MVLMKSSLRGRSIHEDALTIDVRELAHVIVSADKTTARVGGGILTQNLTELLAKYDLVTPVGGIGTIGYTGWAIYGGYGSLTANFGLGVDNIVGAKIVNAKGEIVDADSELLKGIRGAGGAFGVIVELEVKVYKLKNVSVNRNGPMAKLICESRF